MSPEASYDYGWWATTLFNILLFGGFVLSFLPPHGVTSGSIWRT
jgi:hypothetical protein